MKLTTAELKRLERVAADGNVPKALKREVTAAVDLYRAAIAMDREVRQHAQEAADRLAGAINTEPARLLAELEAGRTVTAADVLSDVADLEAAQETWRRRAAATGRVVELVGDTARIKPFRTAAADVLEWVTATRAATDWPDPVPDHVSHAWNIAAASLRFEVPLPRIARFRRLEVNPKQITSSVIRAAARCTWDHLATGQYTITADPDSQAITVHVTGDYRPVLEQLNVTMN